MSLFKVSPVGLEGFVRVTNTKPFQQAFENLYSNKKETLYNNSRIFPFAYLNKGRYSLFINENFNGREGIIPVVKKFEHRMIDFVQEQKPHYEIHSPSCSVHGLEEVIARLDKVSADPVIITDLTLQEAEFWIIQFQGEFNPNPPKWKKVKVSDDVIQDAKALTELKGRNYSSLRNTLKHVREDLNPVTCKLGPTTYRDALHVFQEWKESQGLKYFRVTVGRDLRLIQEYYDKVDFRSLFGYVYYVDDVPVAANFGCRSFSNPAWGQDITVKANIGYKGMGDFAFVDLMQKMREAGITLVNDSGGTGNVLLNKRKFRPVASIPVYNLVRA